MAIGLGDFMRLSNPAQFGVQGDAQVPDDKSTVRLSTGGDGVALGKWERLGSRTAEFKEQNREVRQQLLNALTTKFGGLDSIPDSVKAAMKIKDFKLGGANGDTVNSCRPLTLRRIRAIAQAVTDFEICHQKFDAAKVGAKVGDSKWECRGAPNIDRCVEMYNGFGDEKFEVGKMIEVRQSVGDKRDANAELAKASLKDAGKHFSEQATKLAKSYVQVELVAQLNLIGQGQGDEQFEKDCSRSNIVNPNGGLLSKNVQTATDQMADLVAPGKNFGQLSSAEKTRVNIVKALLHQNTEGYAPVPLQAALNAKQGLTNKCGFNVLGSRNFANFYSFSFDKDGGVSVSLARYKDGTSVMLNYLLRDPDSDAEIPEMKGNVESMTRIDIHIPASEVNRLATLSENNAFAGLDGKEMLSKSGAVNKSGDPLPQLAKIVPDELKINMDVHVAGKIVVGD